MRDPETGNSKGFAFINYASFEAADAALESMNGQYLCNRAITISFAFKKDSKGERHGSAAGWRGGGEGREGEGGEEKGGFGDGGGWGCFLGQVFFLRSVGVWGI